MPALRWQLVQFSALPTLFGSNSRVCRCRRMPRMTWSALAAASRLARRGVSNAVESVVCGLSCSRSVFTCLAVIGELLLPQRLRTKLRISAISSSARRANPGMV
ncbi:hypothetical protein D3C79_963780 [compost metagenome]